LPEGCTPVPKPKFKETGFLSAGLTGRKRIADNFTESENTARLTGLLLRYPHVVRDIGEHPRLMKLPRSPTGSPPMARVAPFF